MDKKKLRKVLVAIKKKMESITEIEVPYYVQLFEIIEQLKAERVIIGWMIETLDSLK